MTSQEIEAFAEEAREWRRVGKQNEKAGLVKYAENAFAMALGIEAAAVKVGKRFNRSFDEAGFQNSCNPD
jgi:predicted TPR repeat methyltransferase